MALSSISRKEASMICIQNLLNTTTRQGLAYYRIEKWKMEGKFGVVSATKVSYHRRMRDMIAESTHAATTDTGSFMRLCGLAILRIDILILDANILLQLGVASTHL